jgi:putative ABC transport system permease protein
LPLTGNKWSADVEIIGSAAAQPGSTSVADRLRLPFRAVTPDYFAAMGMSVVDGRGFRATDDEKAPQVVMINQALARKYFGNANPIGRTIRQAGDTNPKHWMSVIGIVADTRTEDLSQAAEPEVYLSLWQAIAFSKHLIVRTTADPRTLTAQVRSELHAVDPTAAVERVQTMEEIRAVSVAPRTFAMNLLTGFSVAATLLALVGLYGVLSLSVGSRTREIAVRKAIGAQANQILRMIVGEGFWLIGVGVVLGTVVALLLGPALQALLFDVRPTDPVTLAGAALVFTALALIACVVPAWRAVRVDLMEALRHE